VIIGTAGHIDHGKSSLVEALTGTKMDRLREERERGITIELNFAPFDIGEGQLAGIVDVPGHEDFIRTMVAGASGIDLVLLVIAADEGIKPQTREHLAIAEQLGITRGIPVITKIDLVEPEWASLVELEVADWLRTSVITFEPPRPVSVVSKEGMPELAAQLRQVAASIPVRNWRDLFRLPVDRVFSVAGIGTVVTGTAWSGQLAPGDQVMVLPSRKTARVRTVQVHGKEASKAQPGMRVALGLAGLGREEIVRGDTIVEAGSPWEASLAFDVMLSLLPDAPRGLVTRSRIRLHLGTSEIIARVFPRVARIEPGSTGMARLALESPGVARGGDPFVIRGFSPVNTMGGGRVIDPLPPRRRALWPELLADERIEQRLGALIDRRPNGVAATQLPVLLGVSPQVINDILARSERYVLAEDHWVRREVLDDLSRAGLSGVERFHRSRPGERGMPLAELRQSLRTTAWLSSTVLDRLQKGGKLVYQDGVAAVPGHTRRVAGGGEQVSRIVSQVKRAGLAPPSTTELGVALDIRDAAAAVRVAVGDRLLVPVERDRHYAPESIELFVATLAELGKDGGSITPGQVRDRLGISRKFLIPLLEWADATGITTRTGEGRRLREGLKLPWRIPVP
jgi:selenocysteine-specific elongation factor